MATNSSSEICGNHPSNVVMRYLKEINRVEGKNLRIPIARKMFEFIVENKEFFFQFPRFMHVVRVKLMDLSNNEDWSEALIFYEELF